MTNQEPCIRAADTHENSRFYVKGNIGTGRMSVSESESNIARSNSQSRCSESELFVKSFTPVESYSEIFIKVLGLEGKGAGARLPKYDAVDIRAISDVKSGKGGIPNTQKDVGGWPDLGHDLKSKDTDNDGMPDIWEAAHGLDPQNPKDANLDRDADGYLNIEEYINGLFGNSVQEKVLSQPKNLRLEK